MKITSSIRAYGRIPRARRILARFERLHLLSIQFKIIHVGVLIDSSMRDRFGQWYQALPEVSMA